MVASAIPSNCTVANEQILVQAICTLTATLLLAAWVPLVELHAPNGALIFINPEEISSIREPAAGALKHFAPGTHCVLVLNNGHFNAVREGCGAVRAKLQQRQ